MTNSGFMTLRRLIVATAAATLGVGGLGALSAPAWAGAVGELGRVGSFGIATGQFKYPTGLAVDTTDNSAYVLDEPAGERAGVGPTSFRIQKFASTLGAPLASVTVPTPEAGGLKQVVAGIAVDSALHRLYVLKVYETARTGRAQYVAGEIDAYSTEASGGSLPLDSRVAGGVFYTFPVVPPAPEPLPPGTLRAPQGLALDPKTNNLLVLGQAGNGATVIERVDVSAGPSYSSGTLDTEAFVDTTEAIAAESSADSLAVGPDGTIYLSARALTAGTPGQVPGVATLSGSLASPTVTLVHKVLGTEFGEPFPLTGGREGAGGIDVGAQVAVSPDGSLVYASEVSKAEDLGGAGAGNYEVRGMSTAAASLGAQRVVFGGGTSTCSITSSANAIAVGKEGIVYALDEGDSETVEGVVHPSPFGFRLVEFGPNGSGCPTPSAAFKINESDSPTVAVSKGQAVVFNAGESALHGEEPIELEWDLDGTGTYATKVTGSPASLETMTRYLKPGTYTIGLRINLKNGGSFGEPAPVTKMLKVNPTPPSASFEASTPTPKLGEAVTFNGSGSIDPTGSCSQASGCAPTHHLKEYIWNFGDGAEAVTTTPEVSHAFASPVQYSVTLTVLNEEGVRSSTPASQTISVQSPVGSPEHKEASTGGGSSPIAGTVTPVGPGKPPTVSGPGVKPLTKAQKLAKALRACKKLKPKRRRLSCERTAKKRYGPKPKKKH